MKCFQIVMKNPEEISVILISHYEEDIAEVDEVYELKNGVLSKRKGK